MCVLGLRQPISQKFTRMVFNGRSCSPSGGLSKSSSSSWKTSCAIYWWCVFQRFAWHNTRESIARVRHDFHQIRLETTRPQIPSYTISPLKSQVNFFLTLNIRERQKKLSKLKNIVHAMPVWVENVVVSKTNGSFDFGFRTGNTRNHS